MEKDDDTQGIKCTRCKNIKTIEEYGYNTKGEMFKNCVACREKRRAQKARQNIKLDKERAEKPKQHIDEIYDHVNKISFEDELLEKHFMEFIKYKDRICINVRLDDTTTTTENTTQTNEED